MLQNDINVFRLAWIMSLSTLWNLKWSLDMCCHWVVTKRNSRIYPTSTVISRFTSL